MLTATSVPNPSLSLSTSLYLPLSATSLLFSSRPGRPPKRTQSVTSPENPHIMPHSVPGLMSPGIIPPTGNACRPPPAPWPVLVATRCPSVKWHTAKSDSPHPNYQPESLTVPAGPTPFPASPPVQPQLQNKLEWRVVLFQIIIVDAAFCLEWILISPIKSTSLLYVHRPS